MGNKETVCGRVGQQDSNPAILPLVYSLAGQNLPLKIHRAGGYDSGNLSFA